MVFVTVGNALQKFHRLLAAIDDLAARQFFGEQETVFIQSGNNADFRSSHCDVQPFISMDEFNEKMASASLIICHGGCTQLQAIRLGKVPVVMPRRAQYGEHINDHQVQLVNELARQGKIVPAFEASDLPRAILTAKRLNETPITPQASPMASLVAQAIEELVGAGR
jgi:UDP-N-acetylglucosamine transferase subunit ALG13